MSLLSECHVLVYEVRMMWWCCWVSCMCLSMKCGWCDDVDEWVSCVFEWSNNDMMMFLSKCHVFVYEVRMMWWGCWVSVICLCMNLGWCDDIVAWVSCAFVYFFDYIVVLWSEDDVMMLISECHVFVDEVWMMLLN